MFPIEIVSVAVPQCPILWLVELMLRDARRNSSGLGKVEGNKIKEPLELGRINWLLEAIDDAKLFSLFTVEIELETSDDGNGDLGIAREGTN